MHGIIPYVDPRKFARRSDVNNPIQLNAKSDIYSVGILLWEISSGHPPFSTGGQYDIGLAVEIFQGLREQIVPGTPERYSKIYTGKCN